jgi:hypothetical protein
MGISQFIFSVLGMILFGTAFGWARVMVCSHPEAAQAIYWISAVMFAMLGPIWAFQASGYSMKTRSIASVSTVVIAAVCFL